jgi:predicted nucleic acid-binding protein
MEITKLLLDTSAYSAFLMGHSEVKAAIQEADEIYLNPIVLGELLAGFGMGKKEKRNRETITEFLSSERVHFIDIDGETSERYSAIYGYLRSNGKPVPTNDLWIAASAMQHGLKLLTMDKHFLAIPQILVEHHPE